MQISCKQQQQIAVLVISPTISLHLNDEKNYCTADQLRHPTVEQNSIQINSVWFQYEFRRRPFWLYAVVGPLWTNTNRVISIKRIAFNWIYIQKIQFARKFMISITFSFVQ